MNLVTIKVPNWTKYNPRSDRSVFSWFRFQNNFFDDQKLFGCTESQRLLFVALLCEVSKVKGDSVEINLDYIANKLLSKPSRITSDLDELASRGVIAPPIGGVNPPNGNSTDETDGRTDDSDSLESPESLLTVWANEAVSRPMPKELTPGRTKKAKSFLANKSLFDWTEACRRVEASDFLSGRNKKWTKCNFDWLLKPDNFAKVMEGNYDNDASAPSEPNETFRPDSDYV